MPDILYITYDGLSDSLGQSQVLAYLKRLSGKGNKIIIISFEKKHVDFKIKKEIQEIVSQSGLIWYPLDYTKTPPVLSTIYDIIRGYKLSKKLNRIYNFNIVHCRGYISAIIGRKLQRRFGTKFIFDMRGWWVDEKIESGFWNNPAYRIVYNYFKRKERDFFINSDYIVSLTYRGKDEIIKSGFSKEEKIGVIPTCVDFDIFRVCNPGIKSDMREKYAIEPNEKVFIYSGSVGGNYDHKKIIKVFKAFRAVFPNSFLLILSKDKVSDELEKQIIDEGINRLLIINAAFTEVSSFLCMGDAGFIFYKMNFSVIGRSPTKLGEYWASGLPVIAFKGIGDIDQIFNNYPHGGVLLSENEVEWPLEIKALESERGYSLRNYAKEYFSIENGVSFYNTIYKNLSVKN